MSVAALILALAVLVAPSSPRITLSRRRFSERRARRMRVMVSLGAAILVVAAGLPVGVIVGVVAVSATWWWRRSRARLRRRRAVEISGMSAALEIAAGELRAGAHPVSAINAAAGEVDTMVAAPLHAVAARARLGADVPGGLRSVAVDSAQPELWERLAVVWRLADAHGLTMAALVAAAHRDIAERQRFSAHVSASVAGARTTAAILAGLPVLGIGLGYLIGADPVGFLLTPGAGSWFLAVGVVLACGGLLWSDRIVDGVVS